MLSFSYTCKQLAYLARTPAPTLIHSSFLPLAQDNASKKIAGISSFAFRGLPSLTPRARQFARPERTRDLVICNPTSENTPAINMWV